MLRTHYSSRPIPAVIVIHENRGLTPFIMDVARRLAAEGYLALAPDTLSVVGGYPGNDEGGKEMQAKLLIHYAQNDSRVNEQKLPYQKSSNRK